MACFAAVWSERREFAAHVHPYSSARVLRDAPADRWRCVRCQVDHHTVKMHTAFIKNRGEGDFSEWEKAFVAADHDKDGVIQVHEASRIFKVSHRFSRGLPVCVCTAWLGRMSGCV